VEVLENRWLLTGFVNGSIQGQEGWSGGNLGPIDPSVDQAVTTNNAAMAHSGSGSWRISNDTMFGNHNGAFNGWVFGPPLAVLAGQPSSGAGADGFTATLFFRSVSTVADGSNIEVDMGSSVGNDRNNFLAITNEADANGGLLLRASGPNPDGSFPPTQIIATQISRGVYHRLDIVGSFFNGPANDVFTTYLDGKVLTNPLTGGTTFPTFEAYFASVPQPYVLSNRLFFRSGATPSSFGPFSDTAAQGFDFDDLSYRVYNMSAPNNTLAFYATSFEAVGVPPYDPAFAFAVTTSPANGVTGQPLTLTVTALDGANAPATSYTGTVQLTSTDPSIRGLPASYTFLPSDNGVKTFTVMFGTPGNQSITATDTVDSRITGSTAVTIAQAPPLPPPPPPPPPVAKPMLAVGAGAGGGPEVTVYNAATGQLVSSFFAFTPTFTGGVHVAVADLNGDGTPDIICAAGPGGGPQVEVIDGTKLTQLQTSGQIANSALLASFFAFTPTFTGGVFVGAAVSASGQREIVVGAGVGGGPQVEVIDATKIALLSNGQIASSALLTSFFAFTPTFGGGVRVALADMNGDGTLDVITGAGPGGGPQVVIADGTKLKQVQANGQIAASAILSNFFAFAPSFAGGVFVSAGATAGTGQVNLIIGADAGGGPQVEVINGSKVNLLQVDGEVAPAAVLSSFFARTANRQSGIPVGFAGSYGSGGHPAILTGEGFGGGFEVIPFDSITGQALTPLFGSPPGFLGGLSVAG
jgi:hypothetical protein